MRGAVYALTLLLCAGLLGFSIWSWPHRIDERDASRYERQLRTSLALDSRLDAEILKARSGLVAHYDAIVQTAAARKRTSQELRRLPKFLRGPAAQEIRKQLSARQRSLADSERAIDRFKRDDAVLRNSLRYLPALSDELASAGASERNLRAAQLIRDALLLQDWQGPALLAKLSNELEWLEAATRQAPEAERPFLESVLTHARIVYERTPAVQESTRTVLALDASQTTHAMLAAFTRARKAATAAADGEANLRIALAVLAIVAAAASVSLRMRHASELLNRAKGELESVTAVLHAEQAKQQELTDLKSKFVSMVSNQFRTPLSVIMSSAEMLEAYGERWPAEKKQEHFERLRYEALEMSRMLDAILTLGTQEQGLLKFEPRPIEIDPFCGDVLAAVGDATGQRHRVVYHGTGRSDVVLADPTLLRHMLENLLTNALKYSSQDTDVELNVERDDDELRFEVNDHGIGIDRDDLRHMFETFYRGRNVGHVAGTGLGLSIVRGAVELHGGQVAVRSQPDVGTSFMISIPCARSPSL